MILAARTAQENYYFNSLEHRHSLLLKNSSYGTAAAAPAANMKAVSKKVPPPSPAGHQRKIGKRMLFSQLSYFGPESLFLLLCLTASLLLLPLVLPPLPPPPLMLLFVPICILAVLMILAFTPCNVRDLRYPHV